MLMQLKEMPTGGSDKRFKKAIKPLSSALGSVLNLRPVTWQWRDQEMGTGVQYGFIAQEVEKILPDLVSDEKWKDDGSRKFLASDKIVPYLVGAIHEQQKQIQELKALLENNKRK